MPSENVDSSTKRRRRARDGNGSSKKPIRVVSSLGEGKLMDRFQSTLKEKENKKMMRDKSEKDRRIAKEKRDREIAKFQEEINALLEDNPEPVKPKADSNKIYVPKLSGTVKGKFEALEQKKLQEEKSKMEQERRKRQDRDLREKKRIQIEIAKKKQQLKENGKSDDEVADFVSNKRTPGKIRSNFEEITQQRLEKEMKKLELEKKLKISSEIKAVKEYYSNPQNQDNGNNPDVQISPKPAPGKLKNNFDEMLRSREEEKQRRLKQEMKNKLEEEKQNMRAEKLVSVEDGSDENSASHSQSSSCEKIRRTPNRLSSSFTNFDMIEKQRLEDERKKIHERRKMLLEEERKLFEETRKSLENRSFDEDEIVTENNNEVTSPGRLDSSLRKFDILTQQKFEEERERIFREKQRLLEEENQNFKKEQMRLASQQNDESESSNNSPHHSSDEGENSSIELGDTERKTKKLTKRRKKAKHLPNKLDYSKLKFDVLERRRMENESLRMQQQRQQLLEDEKRLFEEARQQQQDENEDNDEDDKQNASSTLPGRLEPTRTKFDILTKQKLEDERERIRNERIKLMEEEKRLMEEERNKLKMQESDEEEKDASGPLDSKGLPKPQKLNKSFTQFDRMEERRKQEEREELYREKAKKLEEERRAFKEARDKMSESDENEVDASANVCRKPSKLSKKFTEFDLTEQRRIEKERLAAQEDRIKKLESEVKEFERQRQKFHDSDDDITSGTKALLKSSRDSPRPKKLSKSLTKFDVMERKRREEEREKLQREKARELEEERKLFERSRHETEGNESDECDDSVREPPEELRSVKRMNVKSKIEAVMRAQEEVERKRIEETKFSRMTVEQQEMYLARERQIKFLKEQLARAKAEEYSDDYSDSDESGEDGEYYYYYSDENDEDCDETDEEENNEEYEEDELDKQSNEGSEKSAVSDGSSGSGAYCGAPYFVQTLNNLSVKEGEPVRFDANINANPHPKVTWYFKNRAIRNSADYQYINKGTQYSLYMNESFVDDCGEYMCKAVNDKGTATSKALLNVIE